MSTEMSVVFENSSCEIQEKTIGRNIMITIMKSITNKVGIVTLLTLIVGGLSLASANAAYVVKPKAATASSSHSTSIDVTIDGTGLQNASTVETDEPIPNPWPDHDQNGGHWIAGAGDTTPWVTTELTNEEIVTGFNFWNYNDHGDTTRGVQTVDISYSTDGSDFTFAETVTIPEAPDAAYSGEEITLGSSVSAKYIKFDVQSNHGDGNYTGFDEVRLTAVPEPGTLTLLVFGAGGLALTQRRRRRK